MGDDAAAVWARAPVPARLVVRVAGARGDAAGEPAPEVELAVVRGLVWAMDAQTGLVSLLVPPPEWGGALGGEVISWLPSAAGQMWSFERSEDEPFCRAVVVHARDVVGAPRVIDMDGDPLVEWWHAMLFEAEQRELEAAAALPGGGEEPGQAQDQGAQLAPKSPQAEEPGDQVGGEESAALADSPHPSAQQPASSDRERADELVAALKLLGLEARTECGPNTAPSVNIGAGLARIAAPFASVADVESSDAELVFRLGVFLFGDGGKRPAASQPANSSRKAMPGKKGGKPSNAPDPRIGRLELVRELPSAPDSPRFFQTQVCLEKYSRFGPRRHQNKPGNAVPAEYADVPKKYYMQRYRLFSRFDQGVRMDSDSWFSVTPETIAEHLAERCRASVIVDAFAGCGGNAIQFAFTCERVIAIERDAARLELARGNARVYGVEDRIEFVHADAIEWMKGVASGSSGLRPDVVFLSPPWGGPDYQAADKFPLEAIQVPTSTGVNGAIDGVALLRLARSVSPEVAFFAPRNSDPEALASAIPDAAELELEAHVIDDRVKTCCLFCGDLVARRTLQRAGVADL
mmetsp:Transcript_9428/g.30144  ORF Transcript_9428/g.30144 Transcript_9428/m.30144 type:complete len:577 (-) Transcript_9428:17-1747(-)